MTYIIPKAVCDEFRLQECHDAWIAFTTGQLNPTEEEGGE